jgi:hypothetical protein
LGSLKTRQAFGATKWSRLDVTEELSWTRIETRDEVE